MANKQTIHTISEHVQDHWESDEPDRILQVLQAFHGKNITTRIVDALPGGKERWYLRRQFGNTNIVERIYAQSGGDKGMSLMLARSESSVPLDVPFVERENPSYFIGRRERNHSRMEARNTREHLEAMADTINRIHSLQAQLAIEVKRFEGLTTYPDGPFSADRYSLRTLAGLDK